LPGSEAVDPDARQPGRELVDQLGERRRRDLAPRREDGLDGARRIVDVRDGLVEVGSDLHQHRRSWIKTPSVRDSDPDPAGLLPSSVLRASEN
jgi:hypothetical protein